MSAIDNPYKMQQRDDLLRIMTAPNAGAHNAVYRGKALGGEVTDAQWAAIAAGTFEDLYIGDYWTKGGVNWRVAAFNYFLHTGDTECTKNHIVIVPDTYLYTAAMNSTNTTAGGYVGSNMYKSGLSNAKTTIKSAFSGHVLKHRINLNNAVTEGKVSGGLWCDSEVDLMCEHMVYGGAVFLPMSDGKNVPANHCVENSQLPLFRHDQSFICNRTTWWLRDVVASALFSSVLGTGASNCSNASNTQGVRPYFCIY